MKLATRISSIRRTRLEGVQVVLAGLGLDVRALAGQPAATPGAPARRARSSTRVDRVLGQPVDLQVRVQLAQLVGDGEVAADVPEPDRRARRTAPACAGSAARVQVRGPRRPVASSDSTNSRISRFARTGSRRVGACPPPRMRHQLAAGPLGPAPPRSRTARSRPRRRARPGPGSAPAGRSPRRPRRSARPMRGRGEQQRLGVGLQPPADAVLPLLGRVRLGEDLGHEELDPAAVVGQPVVPVRLLPALVARPSARRSPGGSGHGSAVADRDDARPRGPGTRRRAAARAARPSTARRRPPGRCRSRPSPRSRRRRTRGRGRPRRSPGRSARPLPRPSTVITRKCRARYGHLRLPLPGVHDRPRGEQHDRRLAVAEHLVADLHAVPLDAPSWSGSRARTRGIVLPPAGMGKPSP